MRVSGRWDLNFVPEKTNVDAENFYEKVIGKVWFHYELFFRVDILYYVLHIVHFHVIH